MPRLSLFWFSHHDTFSYTYSYAEPTTCLNIKNMAENMTWQKHFLVCPKNHKEASWLLIFLSNEPVFVLYSMVQFAFCYNAQEKRYVTVQTKTKFARSKGDKNKVCLIMKFFLLSCRITLGVLENKKSMQNLPSFGSYIQKCKLE